MRYKLYMLIILLFSLVTIKGQTSINDLPAGFYNSPCGCEMYHLGPYSIGTFYSDFSYSNTINTGWDIFYTFTTQTKMDIILSNLTEEYNDSEITFLSDNGSILYRKYDTPKSILEIKDLPPAKYYVWIRETGGNPFMTTSIQGKVSAIAGDSMGDPIYAGAYDTYFSYSDSRNTSSYINDYTGYNTKDVFHSFTISNTMNIDITHTAAFQTKIWLESKEEGLLEESSASDKKLSVTLSPGTYYVVSEGVSADGPIDISIVGSTIGPNRNQNYILKQILTNAVSVNTTPSKTDYRGTIEYYDGLGRPIQTIQMFSGLNGGDFSSFIEYDVFGRKSTEWLPVALPQNNGAYVSKETIKKSAFSQYNDSNPYSQTIYENSPLNRVLQQYGPGQDWHNNKKAVLTGYFVNKGTTGNFACIKFKVSGYGVNTKLEQAGYYNDGMLSVTQVTDEDGNISFEFKNKLDQLILSRQINNGQNHDTYYAYDIFGNQSYVLPPIAVDNLSDLADAGNMMKNYAYLYKYDKYQRCIWKKLPGCEPTYYVYDKTDRLIFSQNGEQRIKQQWMFNKYDAFGRVLITGIYKTTQSHSDLIAKCRDIVVIEKPDGSYYGYSWNSLPEIGHNGVLTINHYDDYDHLLNQIPYYRQYLNYSAKSGYGEVYINSGLGQKTPKGLLVGSITKYMDDEENGIVHITGGIVTAMYYDDRGRLIQTKSTNHLGGIEEEYIAYNFTGQPIKKMHVHSATGKNSQTEVYAYTYDHAGRLLKTTHQLTDGATVKPQVTLAENSYDELGRLQKWQAGGNPNLWLNYDYNVRSWVHRIYNDNLFRTHIHYTERWENSKPSYNGNISIVSHVMPGDSWRAYYFDYDNLSRLKTADYHGPGQYSTFYSYDKHGNIKTLQRNGKIDAANYGLVDNMTMDHTGNQLKKVTDTGVNVTIAESADFKNFGGSNGTYTYNKNGAMDSDSHKGILGIKYNSLNLPQELAIKNINAVGKTYYTYSSSGVKLRTVHKSTSDMNYTPTLGSSTGDAAYNVVTTTDYVGNKIYENGTLKRVLVDGGYIEGGQYYFYIRDYLGNNRLVARQDGAIIQKNYYYPFGTAFAEGITAEQGKQPYKYNGKELDQMHGLNLYDYSARYYESAIGRFTTMDPLAEKYYSISPYAYCANNPIKFIDPTGMAYQTTDQNEIERLKSHLDNGGSILSYDTYNSNWNEVDDPEPPQDGWPSLPMSSVNYNLSNGEQQALEQYSKQYRTAVKATLLSAAKDQLKRSALLALLYATTHAVSVKISVGGSVGQSSGNAVEGVLILAGDYAQTLVIMGSNTNGYGLLSINVTLSGTMYTYLGVMKNFGPQSFAGKSKQASVGISTYGAGASWAKDGLGGTLIGRSLSVGYDGFNMPISGGYEVENSQIKKIIFLNNE